MRLERAVFGSAAVVVGLALLAALALPGAIAAPSEEVRRPGPVRVAEMTVQPGEVSGATAELSMEVQVDHAGNPTQNVTVRFRAIDAESGFLAAETRTDLGTVRADGWQAVDATLRVDREGGYVLVATVFRDGDPADEVRKRVSGMDALTPAYARTSVRFADAGALPTVGVSVVDAGDERTELEVAARLTNEGDDASGEFELVVALRQAESNLIAAETTATVEGVQPGHTVRVGTTVTVPAGYNYYVDVALYRDGVLVDTTRGVANLDPEERISANTTVRDVEFNVSDFERGPTSPGMGTTETSTAMPGFGPVVALLALLIAVAVLRLRGDEL